MRPTTVIEDRFPSLACTLGHDRLMIMRRFERRSEDRSTDETLLRSLCELAHILGVIEGATSAGRFNTDVGGIQMAQANWRWCHKCQGMFFGGFLGVCPAGGMHDINGSGNYQLQDQPGDPGQHNWRWCHKCSGLFFAGNPTTGWCPQGGGHEHQPSSDYSLQDAGQTQSEWRWCHKCQGLFFAANPSSGFCPSGGGHDFTGSDDYHLLIV